MSAIMLSKRFTILLWVVMLFAPACGGSNSPSGFEKSVEQGWSAFSDGDFQNALAQFNAAISKDPEQVAGYTGLGWTQLRLANLSASASAFSIGSAKPDAAADLHAGWAFALNAQKAYQLSNTQATTALGLDPAWTFSYDEELNQDDLELLQAQNYFLLGDFSQSLAMVQILNPAFNVAATTQSGQNDLAAEIERLAGLN